MEQPIPSSTFVSLRPPPAFNFQNPKEWPEWFQEFDDYSYASGLNEKPEKAQVRTLLYSMGREARKILSSFNLTAEEQDNYKVVTSRFDSHFVIRRNEVYESAMFNLRRQLPGESVDQFSTALYSLSEHCNFGAMKERLIRDRFVVGLVDRQFSEVLQMDPKLTLATAMEKARQKEAVQLQQQELSSLDPRGSSQVAMVKGRSPPSKRFSHASRSYQGKKQNPSNNASNKKGSSCIFCGSDNSHPRPKCPASNAICHSCKKRGHFSKVCRSSNFSKASNSLRGVSSVSQQPHATLSQNSGSETSYYIGGVSVSQHEGLVQSLPASPDRLDEIRRELKRDQSCSSVMRLCESGWPIYKELPPEAIPFWKNKDELTVVEGLLLKGPRLVIPQALRPEVLSRLHDGHLGIVKTRARAKQSVWWPGLSSQLKQLVQTCTSCIPTRRQGAEPMIPSEYPARPWEKVATDLFEWKGNHYLLVIDYFSRFPEVCNLASLSSHAVIERLKEIFSRHGIPLLVVSDNGPQYSSHEFRSFASSYGFRHVTSSPNYPQANGEAERAVRTVKNLFERSSDPHLALLAYRNTPGPTGSSPAQLCMGRRLRTRVPTLPAQLDPFWPNLEKNAEQQAQYKAKQKELFDRSHRAHALPALQKGNSVWISDLSSTGVVQDAASTPRSYTVNSKGSMLRRNRRHLIPMPDSVPAPSPPREARSCLGPKETLLTTQSEDAQYVTRYGRKVVRPERLVM